MQKPPALGFDVRTWEYDGDANRRYVNDVGDNYDDGSRTIIILAARIICPATYNYVWVAILRIIEEECYLLWLRL